MSDKLEQRAARALRHPDLAWVMDRVPAKYRDEPTVIRHLLSTVMAFDPIFGDSPALNQAYDALTQVTEARELRDRVAALYHNPELRAQIGIERIDEAWRDPETARIELLRMGSRSPSLEEALSVIYELKEFGSSQGEPWPAEVAAPPIPRDADKLDAEIAALTHKAYTGKITQAEEARRLQLYEAKVEGEAAAVERAAPADPERNEIASLTAKAYARGLTSGEEARRLQLYEAQAVREGLVTQEDLNAETTSQE